MDARQNTWLHLTSAQFPQWTVGHIFVYKVWSIFDLFLNLTYNLYVLRYSRLDVNAFYLTLSAFRKFSFAKITAVPKISQGNVKIYVINSRIKCGSWGYFRSKSIRIRFDVLIGWCDYRELDLTRLGLINNDQTSRINTLNFDLAQILWSK